MAVVMEGTFSSSTRTDNVRQIVGNKRVMSINPNSIGVGNHGGRDILLVNEAVKFHCTGGVALHKVVNCRRLKLFGKSEQL